MIDRAFSEKTGDKIEIPRKKQTMLMDREVRYELPLPVQLPGLAYVDRLTDEQWFTNLHWHEYFEITYIESGEAWFYYNEVIYYARAGECFITKPNELHCGGSTGKFPYVLYGIGFRFEQLRELEQSFLKLGANRIVADAEGTIRSCFRALMEEMDRKHSHSAEMIGATLTEIFVRCVRYYENQFKETLSGPGRMNPLMHEVLRLIHQDPLCRVRKSDELAKLANVSRSHLDREFKLFAGVSLGEYIRLIRLDRAKYLLRNTDEKISAIADMMNFDSAQAFCMFFKRLTDLYPQEYRDRL